MGLGYEVWIRSCGQFMGVWIRSWGQGLGVWIDHGGMLWRCGLDHGTGCRGLDETLGAWHGGQD